MTMTTPMLIDVSTAVGRWPFCRRQSITPAGLSSLLKRAGVDLALTSSLEAVFHEDPDEDNRLLFHQLGGHKRLVPVPVVNPRMADWRDVVGRWAPKAPAVKILPSYHAFSLADANVAALAAELMRRGKPLMVQMRMEDERVQAPAFRVPPVPVADIVALAGRFPRLNIVALSAYRQEAADLVAQAPRVWVDVSMLDGMDTVGAAVRLNRAFAGRLMLGSHSPLYYTRSAVLKVQTAEVTAAVRQAILGGTARKLLKLKL